MSEVRIKVTVRSPKRLVVTVGNEVPPQAAAMEWLTFGLPISPDRG